MHKQQGNILFLILIAVVLFAALSYAVTQSSRGGGSASKETLKIQASEILQYAASMKTAITRMTLRNNLQSYEYCFHHDALGHDDYDTDGNGPNNFCATDKYQVFSANGGGASPQLPSTDWLDSSLSSSRWFGRWVFTDKRLGGIGGSASGNGENDLVMMLLYVDQDLCMAINDTLGIDNPSDDAPVVTTSMDVNSMTPFMCGFGEGGSYCYGTGADYGISHAETTGEETFCYKSTSQFNKYVFVQALRARD